MRAVGFVVWVIGRRSRCRYVTCKCHIAEHYRFGSGGGAPACCRLWAGRRQGRQPLLVVITGSVYMTWVSYLNVTLVSYFQAGKYDMGVTLISRFREPTASTQPAFFRVHVTSTTTDSPEELAPSLPTLSSTDRRSYVQSPAGQQSIQPMATPAALPHAPELYLPGNTAPPAR